MNASTTTTTKTSGIGRLVAHLALATAAGLAALVLGAGPATAQLDPGLKGIFQQDGNGRWVQAGEIFVPEKLDPANYVEHWVLYPNYVYPSGTNRVVTKLDSSAAPVSSEAEFFAQRFPAGSRYVRVLAQESDSVPTTSPSGDKASPSGASVALPLAGTWGWLAGGAGLALSAFHHRRRSR